jgi:hypothetical protein
MSKKEPTTLLTALARRLPEHAREVGVAHDGVHKVEEHGRHRHREGPLDHLPTQ